MIFRVAGSTRRRLALTVLAAWPVFGACRGPTETPDGSRTLSWTEDLRIGSIDEEEYAFTYVTGLSVGPDGRIYVAQWQVPEVWIFEADGAPAGRLGGAGEGPGEFGSVGRLGWIGDTLWVTEAMSSAISLFDRSGRFLDRIGYSAPFPEGRSGFRPSRPLGGGTFLTTPSFSTDAVLEGGLDRIPYLRSVSDGTTIDTLAWRTLRREVLRIRFPDNGQVHTRHPFSASTFVLDNPAGDEIALVDPAPEGVQGGFRLGRISIEGDTLLWRMVEYEPVQITEAAIAQIISASWEESTDWLGDRMTRRAYEEAYVEGLDAPDTYPPVSQAFAGDDGSFWIGREGVPLESVRWETYGPDGELHGSLALPARFRVISVSDDSMWVVDTDELDVQYLVRLTIEPAGSSS